MKRGLTFTVLAVGFAALGHAAAAQPLAPAGDAGAPRTPWGDPDLQGVWNHGTITPLERPAEYAGRERLTGEEVAALNFASETRATSERRPELSPEQDDSGSRGTPAASAAQPSASAERSVLDGVFTSGQASSGERTFRQVCATCHDTSEFSGGRFRISWVGQTAGDLLDVVSTLMPEDKPGSLRPDDYAAVVAYLLSLNGYPAGEAPLPANVSGLRTVRIVPAPAQ